MFFIIINNLYKRRLDLVVQKNGKVFRPEAQEEHSILRSEWGKSEESRREVVSSSKVASLSISVFSSKRDLIEKKVFL